MWDKRQLFDVWTTHTKDCQVCQNALKNIQRLTLFSYIGAVFCVFLAIFLDARSIALQVATTHLTNISPLSLFPTLIFWIAILGAIGLAIIGYALQKLSKLFYVYEFEHSRNN
jgi:ABC-type siderophore export system fused ATPase/permease subunit